MRHRNPTEEEYKQMLANMGKVGGGAIETALCRGGIPKATGSTPVPPPQLPRELVIVGQMPSGKTSGVKEGYTKTGKKYRYPNARFKAWRELAVDGLVKQWKDNPVTFPVRLHCLYWPGDRRTRDVPGIEDAMLHALVKAGVMKDDGLVWDLLWYRQPMNRKGPKVLITVQEWGT